MRADQLLSLWRAYAQSTGESLASVGVKAGLHDKLHRRLAAGLGAHSGTIERAADWFVESWPPGLPWPADIPHPRRACCGAGPKIPAPANCDDAVNAGVRRSPPSGRG